MKVMMLNLFKKEVMKTAEFTINLGGNKVVFLVHVPYKGGLFSITHNDEVLSDGYQSDGKFYFSSISKKVELFQESFEAKAIKTLKRIQKTI